MFLNVLHSIYVVFFPRAPLSSSISYGVFNLSTMDGVNRLSLIVAYF